MLNVKLIHHLLFPQLYIINECRLVSLKFLNIASFQDILYFLRSYRRKKQIKCNENLRKLADKMHESKSGY